jgi:hypothetical protein
LFLINSLNLEPSFINNKLLLEVEKIGDMNIEEIYVFLEHSISREKIIFIFSTLDNLLKPKEIIENAISQLEKEEKFIIEERSKGLSLESIGISLTITRERVRQIEERSIRKIAKYLTIQNFILSLYFYNKFLFFISKDNFLSLMGKYSFICFNILEKVKKEKIKFDLYFDPKLNIIVLDEKKVENFRSLKNKIISIGHQFELDQKLNYIKFESKNELYVEFNREEVEDLLGLFGYKKYGKVFSLEKMNNYSKVEFIFKSCINESLKYDQIGYEILIQLLNDKFEEKSNFGFRNLKATIERTPNVILCDSSVFCYFSKEKFDTNILNDVLEFLDDKIQKSGYCSSDLLFNNFESYLKKNGIESKQKIYSLIINLFKDKYSAKGNTLNIYLNNKDLKKLNREDELIALVEDYGTVLDKDFILEKLKWNEQNIMSVLLTSDKFFNWGTDQIIFISQFEMNNTLKKELNKIIDKKIKQLGFISTKMIFDELNKKVVFDSFLKKYKIDSAQKIYSILSIFRKDLDIKSHALIFKKGQNKTILEIIKSNFKDSFSIEEFNDLLKNKLGYSGSTSHDFKVKCLGNEIFYQVSKDIFQNSKKFSFNKEAIKLLKDYFLNITKDNLFINLEKHVLTEDWRNFVKKLPKIKIDWNLYLVKTYLIKSDFKILPQSNIWMGFYNNIIINPIAPFSNVNEFCWFLANKILVDSNNRFVKIEVFFDFLQKNNVIKGFLPTEKFVLSLLNDKYITLSQNKESFFIAKQ